MEEDEWWDLYLDGLVAYEITADGKVRNKRTGRPCTVRQGVRSPGPYVTLTDRFHNTKKYYVSYLVAVIFGHRAIEFDWRR